MDSTTDMGLQPMVGLVFEVRKNIILSIAWRAFYYIFNNVFIKNVARGIFQKINEWPAVKKGWRSSSCPII